MDHKALIGAVAERTRLSREESADIARAVAARGRLRQRQRLLPVQAIPGVGVGPGAVRDFRGAMAGRGDKGLLITTGTFTADAKKEATRDGAPPIDLIDGDRLCELLKRYDLGVRTATRIVEDITIDTVFFGEI